MAAVIKKVISAYFFMLCLGCILLLADRIISWWDLFDPVSPFIEFWVLVSLAVVLGTLTYGLVRNRPWVIRLHGMVLPVWLVTMTCFTLTGAPYSLHWLSLRAVLYYLLVFAIPFSIQIFLHFCWRKYVPPFQPLSIAQKIGIGAASICAGIVLWAAAGIVIMFGIVPARQEAQPREMCRLETEQYVFISRYYPGYHVTTNPDISVVCVNKNSWFKTERFIWSPNEGPLPDSVEMCWDNSRQLGILLHYSGWQGSEEKGNFRIDTVWIDPETSPDYRRMIEDETEDYDGHRWVNDLNYEGCTDLCTTENDRYKVFIRRYPRAGEHNEGGRTRLLFVDKNSLFEREQVLAESYWGDSAMIDFTNETTVSVTWFKNGPIWQQEGQLGQTAVREYRLEQYNEDRVHHY
jgi:hypothetical protein